MKKLESTWYNMVGVLTAIAVVAGIALAYVNSITREPIAAIQKQTLANGIKVVLQSESLTVEATDTLATDVIVYRWQCRSGNRQERIRRRPHRSGRLC